VRDQTRFRPVRGLFEILQGHGGMKIKAFDGPVLKMLYLEIEAALADLGRRHGISIRVGGARFEDRTAELRLELAVVGNGGRVVRKESEAFDRYHAVFGLEPGDLGRVVALDGEEHRLVGLAPNRPKYPIVLERVRDGKTVVGTRDVLERIIAARPGAS
jgi:hypothetical protein